MPSSQCLKTVKWASRPLTWHGGVGPGTTKLLLGNILIGDRLHNIRASDEQVGGVLKLKHSRRINLWAPELDGALGFTEPRRQKQKRSWYHSRTRLGCSSKMYIRTKDPSFPHFLKFLLHGSISTKWLAVWLTFQSHSSVEYPNRWPYSELAVHQTFF